MIMGWFGEAGKNMKEDEKDDATWIGDAEPSNAAPGPARQEIRANDV